MENDQQPQAELELGNESNNPMPNAGQAEPSKNQSPEDFFSRILSGGQTEQTTDVESSEAPEAAMPEATTEAEEVEVQSQNSDRPTKGMQKRLDKLTALRREAEDRAQQLESEVAELKRTKAVTAPIAQNQYEHINSAADIQAEFDKQRQIRLFCERYPDGYYPEQGEPVTKENIAKAKVKALQAMEEHLPRHAQYLETRENTKKIASSEFTWLNDPTDERTIKAKAFIDAIPEIKRFPDYEIYAAHMVNGLTSYQAQKARAKQQPARVPMQPSVSSSSPSRPQQGDNRMDGAMSMERYRKTGSMDDLANVFKNKFV
jgi:hypothetical protein